MKLIQQSPEVCQKLLNVFRVWRGAKNCPSGRSRQGFAAVFNRKNRRKHSRERASESFFGKGVPNQQLPSSFSFRNHSLGSPSTKLPRRIDALHQVAKKQAVDSQTFTCAKSRQQFFRITLINADQKIAGIEIRKFVPYALTIENRVRNASKRARERRLTLWKMRANDMQLPT